jgi:membrane protein DedA with SNARE-associated domain
MNALVDYLARLPVEWFVLVGAFVQELISPLPSFVVFVPAGASLAAHHMSPVTVVMMAFLAAIGRVAAALLLYWVSGTVRTKVYAKRRRWLGVSRREVKKMEKRLTSSPAGSWWAIFALWAIPVVPGALISLAGGFVRMPLLIFVSATYIGAVINALTYLFVGYLGLSALAAYDNGELISVGVFFALAVIAIIYTIRKHK